ncbi:MAG: hypothetical protein NDI60_00750 [Elusimicrobiales bacterium]|nr:hypothetical protein [Elusimicrobiales bacterium]
MKSAFLPVLFAILTLPTKSFAAWGISGTGGYWEMDARDFELYADYRKANAPAEFGSKITRGSISSDVSLFYETSGGKVFNYGLSVGYGRAPEVKYMRSQGIPGVYRSYNTDENKTTVIPVFLYAKWGPEEAKYRAFLGAGAEYLMARTRTNGYYTDLVSPASSNSWNIMFRKNKVIPGIVAGGEYFLFKNFSLGLNFKYLFSGKVEDFRGKTGGTEYRLIMSKAFASDLEYLNAVGTNYTLQAKDRLFGYDYTGLRANLTARLYFGR